MKDKGKLKTRAFDSAEFLDTPEAIAAYLADALNSGSPAEFQDALNVVARARGMTEIAKAAGVGRENLYNALRSDAHPRFDTVQRVLTALGVRLTIEA
jgi:probable addiction module antidote protein